MGALADCELIRGSLLGQPANAITTFAFVVTGGVIARRPDLRWIGIATVATGIGSFLFHGPMAPGGEWIHDTTLVWLILVVVSWGRRWERWSHLSGLAMLAVAFAAVPVAADPVGVTLVAVFLAVFVLRDRTWATWGPLVLLGAVAIIGRLGATGGPLCEPSSLLQPHSLWHVGAATAVGWWALGRPEGGIGRPRSRGC